MTSKSSIYYRFVFFLALSIIASSGLAFWLAKNSTAQASIDRMPELRGEGAVSYLKDRGLYDSLQNAVTVTTFSQIQHLTAPDGTPDDFFGNSVAISGDTVVTGASPVGKVYVFVRTGGLFTLQQTLTPAVPMGEAFGITVAIDGNTIIVGAITSVSTPGSAYVFVRAGGVWSQQQRLLPSDGVNGDNYGISVGVSGDTAVVGARFHGAGPNPQQGSAFVYVRNSGAWSEQAHFTPPAGETAEFYGDGVAISNDTIVVGSASALVPGNSSAYVYVRTGGVWGQQQHLGPTSGLFGSSVTINGDIIVVGAIFANAAYVFERTGGVWSSGQFITSGFGEFGISASISGDTIVVGVRNNNRGQGAAAVFKKEFGQWSVQQTLTASDGEENDRFGNSVAISDDTIVIGSPFDQVGANANQGSAYIFGPNGPPAIAASSVTVQQGRVVPGAPIASVSDNETSAGALTVSVISGGTASGVTVSNILNSDGGITGNVAASCAAISGTVRLQVTDGGGLSSTADLQVNVTPNDPPMMNCPANIVRSTDPGLCAAIVTFTATATDDCDGSIVPACTPASGSSFAKGVTTVTCTASDTSGHTSNCSFTVTVQDTQRPTIACPANLIVVAARPGDATVIVLYQAPAVEDNCGILSVICTPPSGAAFPLGVTTVTCTVTDTSGNTANCSFSVTVFDVCLQDDANPNTAMVWNSVTGDYRFCGSGVTYTGRGVVIRNGSIFTLTHSAADRRLLASVDATQNRGMATLQAPAGTVRGTINDRDIRNNSCLCALAVH